MEGTHFIGRLRELARSSFGGTPVVHVVIFPMRNLKYSPNLSVQPWEADR